jgi:hypothetical protein
MDLMPYQVTSLLINARKLTGVEYELDGSLDPREFVCVGLEEEDPDTQITKVLVSSYSPWEITLFTVTCFHIMENPWLNFLDHVPLVGWFTRFFVSRRMAHKLL